MVNLSALETEQKLLQPIHKMNNGATTRKQSSRTTILLFSPAATTTKTTLTTTTTRLQAARLPQSNDRLLAAWLPRVIQYVATKLVDIHGNEMKSVEISGKEWKVIAISGNS